MTTPPPADDWIVPTSPPAGDAPTASGRPRLRRYATAAGIVAAGVALGIGGVVLAGQGSSSSDAAVPAAGSTGAATLGPGAGDGRPPGRDGESHVQGTIAKVGASSITVRTASGVTSYPVAASTQILRNGTPATLADLTVGDPVEVHVLGTTSGGTVTVERVLAGTRPAFGPDDRHGDDRPDDGN